MPKKSTKRKDSEVGPKPSYRELDPLEEGGPIARKGFAYQDHVAAGKCLDMLRDGAPAEVWCEDEDDIVLVWISQDGEVFEFVQVKSNEMDQLWSIAKLCERETHDKKQAQSIVEKSLAHDRALGNCRFRLVTCREPNASLKILTKPLSDRMETDLNELIDIFKSKLGDVKSENGNGLDFWLNRTLWEHKASENDTQNENLLKLDHILHCESIFLAPDQKQDLYSQLIQKVYNAAKLRGKSNKELKRITKEHLSSWLTSQAVRLSHPTSAGTSDNLVRKLMDAGFSPGDEIDMAIEQRRKYRQEVLQPKFLQGTDREIVESEVSASLCMLKAQLDSGNYDDSGLEFHSRCLTTLDRLRHDLPTRNITLAGLMHGLMYDIMNRCQHRLVKAVSR